MQQSASAALAAEAKRRKKREKRAARPEAAGWTLGDVLGWAAANGAGEPEVLDRLEQQAIDGAALAALREPEFHELLRDLPDYHGALRLLGPRKRLWLSVRALQKPPEFLELSKAGLLPVATIDGALCSRGCSSIKGAWPSQGLRRSMMRSSWGRCVSP